MDAIGLNLKYIVTNSIYAMDGYHAILGVSIKKSLQREVENFQEQERKLWKLLKSFPNKKKNVRTRLILSTYGHLR